MKLEGGDQYIVEKNEWESIDYEYDHEKKCCIKTVTGKVEQLPLRLAWAITIRKSQPLTFDHVAIDFGHGAFSNGQAHVALSRARTFDGLELGASDEPGFRQGIQGGSRFCGGLQ